MRKFLSCAALLAACTVASTSLRAEDQSNPATSEHSAPNNLTAPAMPTDTNAVPNLSSDPAPADKPSTPPDSEWVHPTR